MIFSSIAFISVFLPIVFILHQILPGIRAKNVMLIIFSLLFYAYGEPVYVLLMIASSVWNYVFALLVEKNENPNKRKAIMAVAVVLNLLPLGYFKYTGFLIETVNSIFGSTFTVPQIILPIGISFFTFQALSYVIDVYRKKVKAEKNYLNVILYIAFFPQLIAGPIVKFHDINHALSERHATSAQMANGFRRFVCGLGKKVLLANVTAEISDTLFYNVDVHDLNIVSAWLCAIACMLQVYYDFSGYSDMAIGMGQMFGFKFQENFNYPYTARTIQEYWRRWHISMTTWFTEYLYFPLGGSRKGVARARLNKLFVFFMTGLWHGANWAYVFWGLYHGIFMVFEDVVKGVKKLPKVIGYVYTMVIVATGYVLLGVDSFASWGVFVGKMFTGFNFTPESVNLLMEHLTPWSIFILIIAAIGAGPMRGTSEKIKQMVCGEEVVGTKAKVLNVTLYVLSVVLLVWCMARLSADTYNPFIYFRF